MRTTTAVAALLLCSILVTGCDLPYEQPAPYGSGGQGALPDGSSALTGWTVPNPFGSGPPAGANDRNGGASP